MSIHSRIEHDTMGEVLVPADALFGAQTQRAVENFPISRHRFTHPFIRALGLIKAAAAKANGQLGVLSRDLAEAIEKAALQVAEGDYDSQFVLDIFQTGSGTSTNMNANEVIARLANADPHDHVNMSQSSNDVIPSAMHIAAAELVHQALLPAVTFLHSTLCEKSSTFDDVIKIGRTHLQDAVPIRLGQEFEGYARQLELSLDRIRRALDGIYELALGGTAVGTGLNAPHGFAAATIQVLSDETKLPFREAQNHFEAQSARDAACYLSGALKTYAVSLTKIANDIRWLASGPRCGLGELRLPAVQPGSSIMPGKVNPVIAESALMVCAQVIGHDATITWACASGNLELNVMMPVIAHNLLESIELLAAATRNLEKRCIAGLEADRARTAGFVEQSLAGATALVPDIGYERVAALVQEACETGRTIRDMAREKSGIPEDRLTQLLDPLRQAGPSQS
jgi:fumarate hydratase class II